MASSFDRNLLRIIIHLLLKAIWDRTLYLFLLELEEGTGRMEASGPNRLLP